MTSVVNRPASPPPPPPLPGMPPAPMVLSPLPVVLPPLSRAFVEKERGVFFRQPVNAASDDLIIDIRWAYSQIMLQLRLVTEQSYLAWTSDQASGVSVWATLFGRGHIRARILPPFTGPWILLLDVVKETWPAGFEQPLEVASLVSTAPSF